MGEGDREVPAPPPASKEVLSEMFRQLVEVVREYIPDSFQGSSILTTWVITLSCVVLALLFVVVFVLFGWWIVWICFLSRFKFVRELLGNASTTPTPTPPNQDTPEKSVPLHRKKPRKRHVD